MYYSYSYIIIQGKIILKKLNTKFLNLTIKMFIYLSSGHYYIAIAIMKYLYLKNLTYLTAF